MENPIYLEHVTKQIPRLLSLLDRNPLSKTYGCFDRQYWHYKICDTPSARCQEATLTLALLYTIKDSKNPYYNNQNLLNWINASLSFWTKIQEKNGSFNEWYPKENSFAATAFTTSAISETLLIIKSKIKNKKRIIKSIIKACNWLSNKNEFLASNQETGAILALHNAYLLTNNPEYKILAEKKLDTLLKKQTSEGWFNEYNGADIGYSSLLLDYLVKYYQKTKNKLLIPYLNKLIDFLSFFIHPNLTFGGIYGSRETEYLIPAGFEIMSKENNKAILISNSIKKTLNQALFLSSIDDRYLSYISYTFLQAYLNQTNKKTREKFPFEKNFKKNFGEAGIYIFSDNNYYFITNYKKGGLFYLFYKKTKKQITDSGIEIKTFGNNTLTSSFLSKNLQKISQDEIQIINNFKEVKTNLLTPSKNILSRIFQLSIGRNEKIGFFIKKILRKKLITDTKTSKLKFKRTIQFKNEKIIVTDQIFNPKKIKEIILNPKSSYLYIPSSKYFQNSNLKTRTISFRNTSKIIRIFEPSGNCKIISL